MEDLYVMAGGGHGHGCSCKGKGDGDGDLLESLALLAAGAAAAIAIAVAVTMGRRRRRRRRSPHDEKVEVDTLFVRDLVDRGNTDTVVLLGTTLQNKPMRLISFRLQSTMFLILCCFSWGSSHLLLQTATCARSRICQRRLLQRTVGIIDGCLVVECAACEFIHR